MMDRKDRAAGRWEGSRCNCTALRKASRRISQLYDTALASGGLKATQRAILAQIGRSELTTVGKLAEALVMDPGALAHTLKPLERDGLVDIAVDPTDRRNRQISLTRRGRAKLAETDALWEKAQRGFEAALGRAESESLRETLRFLTSDTFVAAFENTLSRAGIIVNPNATATPLRSEFVGSTPKPTQLPVSARQIRKLGIKP
jgi:DNA-binding MarR family transcriptional regulator